MKTKKLKKLMDRHAERPIHHIVAEIAVHAKDEQQATDHVMAVLSDDAALTPWLAFATAHAEVDDHSYGDLLRENAELRLQLAHLSESESIPTPDTGKIIDQIMDADHTARDTDNDHPTHCEVCGFPIIYVGPWPSRGWVHGWSEGGQS